MLKLTTATNGQVMYFLDGRRISTSKGLILAAAEQTPLKPTKGRRRIQKTHLKPTKEHERILDNMRMQTAFKKNKVKLCDRLGGPTLILTKILSKTSLSDVIICFGTLFDTEVVLKISYKSLDAEDNSLAIETGIYSKLVPRLMTYTPNLVAFVGYAACGDFIASFPRKNKFTREIVKQTSQIPFVEDVTRYDYSKATLLVTQKAGGDTLKDWLCGAVFAAWSSQEQDLFLKDVLLQVAYTLVVFEDAGLMHNDLHHGNIFIEELQTPMEYSVQIGPEYTVRRPLHFFVRIFDFDRSAKSATKHFSGVYHNTLLSSYYCKNLGECNAFRVNVDWFTVMANIYNIIQLPVVTKIVNQTLLDREVHQVGNNDSIRRFAHLGHPCECVGLCHKCKKVDLADSKYIKLGPEAYIRTFFDASRHTPMFVRPSL